MRCTFLGTGTSHGIPVIACACPCCRSTDSRDKRFRSSFWITDSGGYGHAPVSILIDIGPDFRLQALKFKITSLDALLLTHGHADHLNGLDDIRIFSRISFREQTAGKPGSAVQGIPVYGDSETLKDIHNRFSYIFQPVMEGGGKPKIHLEDCRQFSAEHPLKLGRLEFTPVPMKHGSLDTTGWIVSNGSAAVAYLTDCNYIPPETMELLTRYRNLEHLVIDGLRERPHSTHLSFLEALEYGAKTGARHIWLTHICHDMKHREIQNYIAGKLASVPGLAPLTAGGRTVEPAYDGLTFMV